jgi:apolipoprotein N-acyltransferase
MPAVIKANRKLSAQKKSSLRIGTPASVVLTALAGAILGLSAPGFDYWYLAWFALAPFFLLIVSAPGAANAMLKGFVFGTAYNLVYLNWYLSLHPLDWLGFHDWQSILLAAASWIIISVHQGLIFAAISLVIKAIPLCGGFLPRKVDDSWCVPSLIVLPLLWVLFENKLGNAPSWLGVPWSMIEYSQYHQLPIIQIASVIGGIGLAFFIVMVNVAISGSIANLSEKISLQPLSFSSKSSAFTHLLGIALIAALFITFGLSEINSAKYKPQVKASVLQGNINIEMQKTKHKYTLLELMAHYQPLVENCPSGLCIWTESSLPTYLAYQNKLLANLKQIASDKKLDMIIGSIDKDGGGRPYNAAFGIASDGTIDKAVYHKRYLVPFGEYTPDFVKYLPSWVQQLTNTPAGTGFAAGKFPVVLNLSDKKVAPLICFETISPELTATSVRNGGNLLVNITDLAWFHDSMIGQQMIAFSVFRAIENRRYFIFAANTGPSAIIDPLGKISSAAAAGKKCRLTGQVSLNSKLSLFTQWFN